MRSFRSIAVVVAAQIVALAAPAIAQGEDKYHPIDFRQPIATQRGELSPIGDEAMYLSEKESCDFAKVEWGWGSCNGLDKMAFVMGQGIDTLVVNDPVSDGFVRLDDFFASGATAEIDSMTEDYKAGLAEQAKRLGKPVEFVGWRIYPTADKVKNLIYYALDSKWDGNATTNVKVMLLDRYGYVAVDLVPARADLGAEEIKDVVGQAVGAYKAKAASGYADFQEGDQIAAYGGLGVLAAVLGVKFGKVATVGLFAGLALLLKKGAFLIIVPLVALGGYIKRLFRRKPDMPA